MRIFCQTCCLTVFVYKFYKVYDDVSELSWTLDSAHNPVLSYHMCKTWVRERERERNTFKNNYNMWDCVCVCLCHFTLFMQSLSPQLKPLTGKCVFKCALPTPQGSSVCTSEHSLQPPNEEEPVPPLHLWCHTDVHWSSAETELGNMQQMSVTVELQEVIFQKFWAHISSSEY